jgi:lycopene cyclase domain-containing protein
VFDSFIVSLGIVAYDHTKLLGLSIGSAPIEDFFYAILAGFMIPLLWKLTGRYDKKR